MDWNAHWFIPSYTISYLAKPAMEWTWVQSSNINSLPETIIHKEEVVGDSEMLINSEVHSTSYAEDDAESCCYEGDYEYEDNSCTSNEEIGRSVEDVRMLMMKKPASDQELDRLFWETCLETGLPVN